MYSFGQPATNSMPAFNAYGLQPSTEKERTSSTSSSVGKVLRKQSSDSASDPPAPNINNEKPKVDIKAEPVDQQDTGKLKNGLGLDQSKNSKGLLSSVFGIFSRQPNGPKAMILPPDKEKKVFFIFKVSAFSFTPFLQTRFAF
jgi:hypothetical protein